MLTIDKYKEKVANFIHEKQFTVIINNPTLEKLNIIKNTLNSMYKINRNKQKQIYSYTYIYIYTYIYSKQ
jgi:hypothetical protein